MSPSAIENIITYAVLSLCTLLPVVVIVILVGNVHRSMVEIRAFTYPVISYTVQSTIQDNYYPQVEISAPSDYFANGSVTNLMSH